MIIMLVAIVGLIFGGCNRQYSDFFPYNDDGTPKPHVALLPVIDNSSENLSWNFSEEFSTSIRKELQKHGKLFLPSSSIIDEKVSLFNENELITSSNLKPYAQFQPAQYVVLLELVEHKEIPYKRSKIKPIYPANIPDNMAAVIMMKVRMKIVNIIGGNPKILRQEIISSNHMVKNGATNESLKLLGTPAFLQSPLHLVHQRLSNDLAEKIEWITSRQR